MMGIIEKATIADPNTKGYKFLCGASFTCRECSQQPVAFITQNLEEAYQHSRRNNVAMWISKD